MSADRYVGVVDVIDWYILPERKLDVLCIHLLTAVVSFYFVIDISTCYLSARFSDTFVV